MSFNKCLIIGKKYEQISIEILKRHGFINIILDNSYNSFYDLTAERKKKKILIEVKYNSLTDRTGYIFLECCKINLTASGISITDAEYYIFYSESKYWIVKTNKIKILLEHTIKRELKKNKLMTDPTDEQLFNYIEFYGIKTKNTIGILLLVDDVKKISKFKGKINNTVN